MYDLKKCFQRILENDTLVTADMQAQNIKEYEEFFNKVKYHALNFLKRPFIFAFSALVN